MPIPSPCISVCQIDSSSQLCRGCWRTLDEIAAWSTSTDATKEKVWTLIAQRKTQHHQTSQYKQTKTDKKAAGG